jgi:hypothetical protein
MAAEVRVSNVIFGGGKLLQLPEEPDRSGAVKSSLDQKSRALSVCLEFLVLRVGAGHRAREHPAKPPRQATAANHQSSKRGEDQAPEKPISGVTQDLVRHLVSDNEGSFVLVVATELEK